MLGYIAVLALVCFACAFKGRKLPQKYNEARFITFSMLLYLMSWVIFVPIYVTTSGKYLPAVEMVVILISNYGILSCHFFPKCYVILFKKEHNTKSAFMKNVYEYSRKGITDSSSVSETSVSQTEDKCISHPYSISSPSFFMSTTPVEPTAPQNCWSVDQNIQSIDTATHCTVVDHGVFFAGQMTRPHRLRRSMSLWVEWTSVWNFYILQYIAQCFSVILSLVWLFPFCLVYCMFFPKFFFFTFKAI